MHNIVVIGDLAVDIVGHIEGAIERGANLLLRGTKISPGGVAGNMAWYLSQMGNKALIVGAVGDDHWGDFIRDDLKAMGAIESMVKTVRGTSTGFFVIVVDANGERTMIGSRGANEKVEVDADELVRTSPFWIHLSGYTLLNSNGTKVLSAVIEAADRLKVSYSVDLEGIGEAELKMDNAVVFCNSGKCPGRLSAKLKVIKAGSDGCYLDYNGRVAHYKPPFTDVVNTTGAGDSFNAAFISACLSGRGYEEACSIANLVASYKVGLNDTRVKLPGHILGLLSSP